MMMMISVDSVPTDVTVWLHAWCNCRCCIAPWLLQLTADSSNRKLLSIQHVRNAATLLMLGLQTQHNYQSPPHTHRAHSAALHGFLFVGGCVLWCSSRRQMSHQLSRSYIRVYNSMSLYEVKFVNRAFWANSAFRPTQPFILLGSINE